MSKKTLLLRSKLSASGVTIKPIIKNTKKKYEEESDIEIEIKSDGESPKSEAVSPKSETSNIEFEENKENNEEQNKTENYDDHNYGSQISDYVADISQEQSLIEEEKPKKVIRKSSKNLSRFRIKEDDLKKVKKTKAVVKKGPGRPRKTPKKEPIPRKGISKHPSVSDAFIEFVYDQPVILKKIFQFFKALAASQIHVIFRHKDIIFYTEDHHKKSKIRVRIDASKINHYYCKDTLDIGISSKEMELILNKVDKEYSTILLLSSMSSKNRTIDLILENDIQIDELHTIELINPSNKMENENEFTDEDYIISFELPSKYFRKTINDIKTMSTELSITQESNSSPLVFEYLTSNKKIQSKHTVKNNNKIKLKSQLDDGESFRIDIRVDYIKPISSAQIAEDIVILVDENRSLMTRSFIDNETIEIKTLTEIIDERPDDDE